MGNMISLNGLNLPLKKKKQNFSLLMMFLAWLYGEGDSASRDTYQSKLNELQVLGSPIELRRTETEARGPAIESLKEACVYYTAFVNTKEEKYEHIGEEQRQKVADKVQETEEWLAKMTAKQAELAKTADPVFLSSEIERRKESLTIFCNTIVNTPKPKKKDPEPKKEEDKMQTEEKPDAEATAETTPSSA